MQKFILRVTEKIEKLVEVEADDLDAALMIADEMMCDGSIDLTKNFDDYDLSIELA